MSIQSAEPSNAMSFWRYKKIYYGITPKKILDDLERICKIENLCLESLKLLTPWARDPILLPGNKTMLFPARIKKRRETDQQTLDFLFTIKQLYSKEGRPFQQSVMGWVLDKSLSKGLIKANCHNAREVPFYFEGGNLIKAQNSRNETVYLSGASNLLYTLLNAGSIPYYATQIDAIVERVKKISEEAPSLNQDQLERVGLIESGWSEPKKMLAMRIFHALMETIKEVMANEFEFPLIHLGDPLEAPPDFHLDLYLLPAPGGIMFLQDHQKSWDLLESLKDQKNCTKDEIDRIHLYQEAAIHADEDDREKLNRIAEKLKQSDFKVIRVAGCFYTNGVKKSIGVNFLNAVTGIGKKCAFCITNASKHSVDKFLRQNWSCVMQNHGIENVYFTPKNGSDRLAKLRGGVRCLVQTLSEEEEEYDFRLEEEEKSNCEKVPYFSFSTPLLIDEIMKRFNSPP